MGSLFAFELENLYKKSMSKTRQLFRFYAFFIKVTNKMSAEINSERMVHPQILKLRQMCAPCEQQITASDIDQPSCGVIRKRDRDSRFSTACNSSVTPTKELNWKEVPTKKFAINLSSQIGLSPLMARRRASLNV